MDNLVYGLSKFRNAVGRFCPRTRLFGLSDHIVANGVGKNLNWGLKGGSSFLPSPSSPLLAFFSFFPSLLFFPFPFLTLPSYLHVSLLKTNPLNFSYRAGGSAANSPGGVWGKAAAEIELGAIIILKYEILRQQFSYFHQSLASIFDKNLKLGRQGRLPSPAVYASIAAMIRIIIIIIIKTRSRRWTDALSAHPDHQPLSRPPEQLNVSPRSERHVTRYIAVFLAFFANQDVVPFRHVTQPTHEGVPSGRRLTCPNLSLIHI